MNASASAPKDWHARAAALRYETRHFIGGEFVDSLAGGRFTVVNPATGRPLCTVAEGRAEDIDRAVHSAQQAFRARTWSRMAPRERMAVLARFSGAIEANAER